jgi:hypothetical protein
VQSKSVWASIATLVAANLLPIVGVVLWQWQVRDILFLYWFENIILGAFYILRVLCTDLDYRQDISWGDKLVFAGLFLPVYGGLCFLQAMFLVAFFHPPDQPEAVIGTLVRGLLHKPGAYLTLLAIAASHAVAFFLHDPFTRGEYTDGERLAMAFEPFKRALATGPLIFVGGFALEATGNQVVPMTLLVAVKIGIDAYMLTRERAVLGAAAAEPRAGP